MDILLRLKQLGRDKIRNFSLYLYIIVIILY